jgi:hypothetical protein
MLNPRNAVHLTLWLTLAAGLAACLPPEDALQQPLDLPVGDLASSGNDLTEVAFPGIPGEPIAVTLETDSGPIRTTGVVQAGWVVIQGDIVLGRLEDLEPTEGSGTGPLPPSAGIRAWSSRWEDRTIPYTIDPGFSVAVQTLIADAVDLWEDETAMNFVLRTTQADYVELTAATANDCADGVDNDGDGDTDGWDAECARGYTAEDFSCWSSLGFQGGPQDVFLNGCSAGSIAHELGHAMGLYHEQSRCDRDDYVTINWAHIDPTAIHNFATWGACDSGDDGYDNGPYDYDSIMHYGPTAFSIDGSATITPLVAAPNMGQRTALTAGDIEGIRRMYAGEVPLIRDLDSDGFDDLAIGVRRYTVSGASSAGAVNIIHGSDAGLTSVGDQLWSQDSSGISGTAEASDYFGYALAMGDFDGDTFGDLAIGVPFEEDSLTNSGSVNVLYGTDLGLDDADDQVWSQNSSGVEDACETNDSFGYSVVAGDFDGDGFADLAVGVPWEGLAASSAGGVEVLYGTMAGLDATGDQFWHQNSSGVQDTEEYADRYGHNLTVGDFDGDSSTDLVVGVPWEDVGAVTDAGAISVLYGSDVGLTEVGDQFWSQSTTGVSGTAETSDMFGWATTAGDFDGDGFADLAIGVPKERVGAVAEAGAVNVLYGSSAGLTTAGEQLWSQDTAGVSGACETGDGFGFAVQAGDFNGDGYWDLAIGAYGEDIGTTVDAGSINVLYGTSAGLSTSGEQWLYQGSSGVADSAEATDDLGIALTAGDYNGDGYMDLVAGVPGEDTGASLNHGSVHVFYGSATGLSTADDTLWSQLTTDIEGNGEADSDFGYSLP